MDYKAHLSTIKHLTIMVISIIGFTLFSYYHIGEIYSNLYKISERKNIADNTDIKYSAIKTIYRLGGIDEVIHHIKKIEQSLLPVEYFILDKSMNSIYSLNGKIIKDSEKRFLQETLRLETLNLEESGGFVNIAIPLKEFIYFEKRVLFNEKNGQNISIKISIIPIVSIFIIFILLFAYMTCRTFKARIKTIIDDVNRFNKGSILHIRCLSQDDDMGNLVSSIESMVNTLLQAQSNLQKQNIELQDTVTLLNEYKKAVDESNIVSKSDIYGKITYVNDNFCITSGYDRDEVIGKPHSLVRSSSTPPEVFENMWETIKNRETWRGLLKNRRKDGTHYYIDITILPILNRRGEIEEFMAIRHDITELVEKRRELEDIAQTDKLTGLGNRFKLLKDLELIDKPALAIVDIDSFNEINDFYGYQIGDKIIQQFGLKIKENIPTYYKLYHLHGDDFAILSDNVERNSFIYVIENLYDKLSKQNFKIDNRDFMMQVTVSVSFENSREIVQTADMTKKLAKRKKRHISIYSKEMQLDQEYRKNIEWTDKVKKALSSDRIIPYYQPIYNNKTNKIEKYEALVRMIDTDGKVISPFFFLDIAKKSKQYLSITKRVIAKSFDQFKESDKEFSINLTIEDILSSELTEYLYQMLDKYNTISSRLVLEIVESEGIENYDDITEFIKHIKSLGCKVAIDDFGTGYSNFDYMLKLSPDLIKIDGSMIKNIDTDSSIEDIVQTIVTFAKNRGFKTVAEFVSSEAILNKVKELGIDYSQGFHISEPLDGKDI